MPLKRFILEMGAGNDLHGGDYTKAALRAVQGNYLENGRISEKLRKKGVKPETKYRPE